jgi:hypothetical protein
MTQLNEFFAENGAEAARERQQQTIWCTETTRHVTEPTADPLETYRSADKPYLTIGVISPADRQVPRCFL